MVLPAQGSVLLPGRVLAMVRAGNDVVVDHVLLARRWAEDLAVALKDVSVLFVGLRCPIEVLEEREIQQGASR